MATINYKDPSTKQWIEIPTGITVDTSLSSTSENPVQNKVINSALGNYYTKTESDGRYVKSVADIATSHRVYVCIKDKDETVPLAETPTAYGVAQYSINRSLQTDSPTEDLDSVNKKYGEDNYYNLQIINFIGDTADLNALTTVGNYGFGPGTSVHNGPEGYTGGEPAKFIVEALHEGIGIIKQTLISNSNQRSTIYTRTGSKAHIDQYPWIQMADTDYVNNNLENYYTKTESDVKYSQATNLENGTGQGSLVQKYVKNDVDYSAQATGIDSVAFGGLRFDYDPTKHSGDTTNTAAGNQSFVAGCGNYTAGDWSFVTGKDNTVYSNRAFVSGGANVSQATDSNGNLIEEKTNVGRFNAIFGNNNTFKSSNTSKESNLIAGGSNTVDTERSIVVGYNNDVTGCFDAIFGSTNVVNADYSLTGGRNHVVNSGFHLVAGSDNEVSGQFNIASGRDNKNLGWSSAVIGRGLIVGETHTSQTILGQYNDNKPDTVLEIGWGDSGNRKNIFEVYRDGVVKTEKGTLSTEEYARSYTDSVVASFNKISMSVTIW